MSKTLAAFGFAITMALASQPCFAADPFEKEIKARKAVMQVYAFNLGLLGAMAKGKAPYDATVANAAAQNLLAVVNMDNSAMWPEGSDAGAPGLDGKTRAKAEAWAAESDVGDKHQALAAALGTMAAEAGAGLDAVKANMGAVGKGCKGCHKSFRAPEK